MVMRLLLVMLRLLVKLTSLINNLSSASTLQIQTIGRLVAVELVAAASSDWSVGVPVPVGYSVYDFERFRPHLNMFREYQISYQPSLWEEYSAYRMWGRRGQAKQWRSSSFVSEAEALGWVQRMVVRRLR